MTAGPWRWVKRERTSGDYVVIGSDPAEDHVVLIARMYRRPNEEDDARLIAAAPDLLAALQGLLFEAEQCGDDMGTAEDYFPKELQSARDAIAKARGTRA